MDATVIDHGFETPVKIGGQGHSKYIDFLWEWHIAIEMKSKGENLAVAAGQLQRYMNNYVEGSKPDGSDLSHRIADLFEVLNMPDEARSKRTRSRLASPQEMHTLCAIIGQSLKG